MSSGTVFLLYCKLVLVVPRHMAAMSLCSKYARVDNIEKCYLWIVVQGQVSSLPVISYIHSQYLVNVANVNC